MLTQGGINFAGAGLETSVLESRVANVKVIYKKYCNSFDIIFMKNT